MASNMGERPYKKVHLYRSFAVEVITLLVGGGEGENAVPGAAFKAHKNILCNASPFFKKACQPESIKPEDSVIKLPMDDAEAVQAMLYWMYHDEIGIVPEIYKRSDPETAEDAMKTKWGLLVKLFVLGEKYQIPRLRNDSIDAFLALVEDEERFELGVIPYAYLHTLNKESPLRKLLLKCVREAYLAHELEMMREKLCPEFIFEMALHCYVLADSIDPRPNMESHCEDWCLHLHEHCPGNESRCFKLKLCVELSEDDE